MKKIIMFFLVLYLSLDIYTNDITSKLAPQTYYKNSNNFNPEIINLLNEVLLKYKKANLQVNINPRDSNLRKIPMKLVDEYDELLKKIKIESMYGNIISNGLSNILIIGHQNAGKSYLSEKILIESNKWELIVDDFISGVIINEMLFAGPVGLGSSSVMIENKLFQPKNQFVPITHIIYISVDDNVDGFIIEEIYDKIELIYEQRKIAIENTQIHDKKTLFQFPNSWFTSLKNIRVISIKRNSAIKGIKEINRIFNLVESDVFKLNVAKHTFLLTTLST